MKRPAMLAWFSPTRPSRGFILRLIGGFVLLPLLISAPAGAQQGQGALGPITLLEEHNRLAAQARARGEPLSKYVNPELRAQVAAAVTELGDPRAIPALIGALGSGSNLVPDALADFGEAAAHGLLRFVADSGSDYDGAGQGLKALRFMVEGAGTPPIADSTRQEVRRVVRLLLAGTPHYVTLWHAMDVCAALNDAECRRTIEVLATNRDSVTARGITHDGIVEATQRRAAQRLSSGPFAPRYRDPAARKRQLEGRPN